MLKETLLELTIKSNENIYNYILMNLFINSTEGILENEYLIGSLLLILQNYD